MHRVRAGPVFRSPPPSVSCVSTTQGIAKRQDVRAFDGLVTWDRSVARYTGSKPAPRDPYPFNVNFHHILRPALRPGDATVAQPLI